MVRSIISYQIPPHQIPPKTRLKHETAGQTMELGTRAVDHGGLQKKNLAGNLY